MAETPTSSLAFKDGCPDCGKRSITLPPKLPTIPEDIDLVTRDYDGFRLTMLEDLAARFPDRRRWTPGEIEVVIVEVLAAALDEVSHDIDRLQREAYLETARTPASVRRLLSFIGYDAVGNEPDAAAAVDAAKAKAAEAAKAEAEAAGASAAAADEAAAEAAAAVDTEAIAQAALDRVWLLNPERMESARAAGPRAIHTNRRMVTLEDHAIRLTAHPLVNDAAAESTWTGAWTAVYIAVIAIEGQPLDTLINKLSSPDEVIDAITQYHNDNNNLYGDNSLPDPFFTPTTTIRVALRWLVEAERMIGRQAILRDAVYVPISMALSVRIDDDYFASEIRSAVEQTLSIEPGGFFAPGNHTFGEDLRASEIFQVVGAIDGIDSVCLNRFKRMGKQFPDNSDSGVITLDGIEVVVCNNSGDPSEGIWTLNIHGGRAG